MPYNESLTMYKVIALLKAKSDISREEFIEYYENNHVPLILRHMPQMVDYRRNYVQFDTVDLAEGVTELDFDAVTEFCFSNRADYDSANLVFNLPEVLSEIIHDEEQFLDRDKTRLFVVEEHVSKIDL